METPTRPSPSILLEPGVDAIPPLDPAHETNSRFQPNERVWYHDETHGTLKNAVVLYAHPGRDPSHENYDIEFVNGQRQTTAADHLRKGDQASARTLSVALPNVPAGTYQYMGVEKEDGERWAMKYGKTGDSVVIVLFVDHNPECAQKQGSQLTVQSVQRKR